MARVIGLLAVALSFINMAAVSLAQVPYAISPFWQTSEPNMYSTGMIWRDANNDGYIDVFYSNGNDIVRERNTVYISNRGVLPVSASWLSANYEYSGHCTVGDVNDDGWPDMAVSNFLGADGFSTPNRSDIYLNSYGTLNANPDWYSGDSIYTFSCAFGDADGDGDLDLAVATGESYNSVDIKDRIYFNVEGQIQTLPGWLSAAATEALDVTWGDVDNDGDLDLAFCYNDRPAALYINRNGQIDAAPSWQPSINESANTILFGDINNDGWLDLLIAYNYQLGGQGYFRAYYNDGAGHLGTTPGWQSGNGGYGSALALYDYDRDGDLDLAAGRWWDRPRIYLNQGGVFSSNPVWQASPATVVEEMAFADVDGDGVESRADTIYAVTGKKVFYTSYEPLHAVDSVMVDGVTLGLSDYCYDLVSGWVALGQAPVSRIVIFYQYSFTCDLAISNWDTYNMVFGNTNLPYVKFAADTTFGFVPLTVSFTDNSLDPAAWNWKFGDGGSSSEQNPVHTYTAGGGYDVYLEAQTADGRHNHTNIKMIIALADTLELPNISAGFGATIKAPIRLTNSQPLKEFVVAVSFQGAPGLEYLGFDTDSCRTDYFASVEKVAGSSGGDSLAFAFTPGIELGNAALSPGTGPIINLYLRLPSLSGIATLDTVTVSGYRLNLDAGYVAYRPYVIPGSISIGFVCGDANADGDVNLGDAVSLINYVFKGGAEPLPYEAGEVNLDGVVNLADAVYLINYIFKGGPAPCTEDTMRVR